MDQNAITDPDYEIDSARLERLLIAELHEFQRNFEVRPISEEQELRGVFIAWLAAFVPEVISKVSANELENVASGFRSRGDYRTSGWYRSLPLEIALFALTDDYWWLKLGVWNIDHGTSSLRELVVYSLALVADRLDFHDSELHKRIAYNLEVQHFYCDECIIILAVANGSTEAKRALFKDWHARFGEAPFGGDVLSKLMKGDLVPNPFLAHFLRVAQYVCLRLAEKRSETPDQIITAAPAVQGRLPIDEPEEPLGRRMWRRMISHPLSASHIQLERAPK